MSPPLRLLIGAGLLVTAGLLLRWWLRGMGRSALLRFRSRIDRFKLVDRRQVHERLLADPIVRDAIEAYAAAEGVSVATATARARGYAEEIVPGFSVVSYYKVAYNLAALLTRTFYRVSATGHERVSAARTPRRDALVYVMNHRSNIDSAVLTYVLAGEVSISYAVGEWARTWPLEGLFKSFGSYFLRRGYPEPLYHAVLARYVALITSNRVTQALYPEGGLTRDGCLRSPKLGLLDYIFAALTDPEFDGEIWVVPVGINYDRVLEDRTLVRELLVGATPLSRWDQLRGVIGFLSLNLARLLGGQRRRVGRVAIRFGRPIGARAWFASEAPEALGAERAARRTAVQRLAEQAMAEIAANVPVTPVPFVAAGILSFPGSVVSRARLVERLHDLHATLEGSLDPQGLSVEELLDRASRTFRVRRWVVADGDQLVILPNARPLLEYYANSIRHLLPPAIRWALSPTVDDDPSLPRLAIRSGR
ncbi:MAG: 1-acyl-sn-glycerol-3-phosphate acyltransferase [Gemmatimonadales bacterium]